MDVTSQNQSRSREILILALQEQLDALNRLGALTRLMADLGSAHNTGDLLHRALVGLPRVIDPVQRGEILLADATGVLIPAASFGDGPPLLLDGSEAGSGPLLIDGGRRILADQLADSVPRMLPADDANGVGAVAYAPVV